VPGTIGAHSYQGFDPFGVGWLASNVRHMNMFSLLTQIVFLLFSISDCGTIQHHHLNLIIIIIIIN
jgi:hypothetical protein